MGALKLALPHTRQRIGELVGRDNITLSPLSGGCVGQVLLVEWKGSPQLVAKIDDSQFAQLDVEAFMLRYLREHTDLPVPSIIYADQGLLLLEYLPGENRFSAEAEQHAAELMVHLHAIGADFYGFQRDTLIGGLTQPNDWAESWLEFFAERRLRYMARLTHDTDLLPISLLSRVDRLCDHLDDWLDEPQGPALIHGDAWAGNVLATDTKIVGFLDPAIYFADPEIELAFMSLFDSFGESFFRRYRELRPIAPGFMSERRHLYNLYPLLVHVRLFGGGYVNAVDRTLTRFGY
ncbi:MAG: fructosamine kinase family protein [Candidatus Promineifilaceae bacterium]|nr:fructosamine kinase family protein [Candidatus Promineifilaceae bacterium]